MQTPESNPEQSLQLLLAGNRRYALGVGTHPNQTLHHRDGLLAGQKPVAVVIGCSDSRVPPEIIFDCGLGDLFVIRLAGNVVDDFVLASAQYAVEHLGVKLILVMGHGDCGAVKSAIAAQGTRVPGPLGALLEQIAPAVAKAAAEHAGDAVENSVIENIGLNVMKLKEAEWAKGLRIHGAFYSLKSGLIAVDPEV